MKYDFTTILDRQGHDAIAIDSPFNYQDDFAVVKRVEGFDVIPMWVADMNFPVLPAIQEAIINRVNHPSFGYFKIRDEYYNAIIDWHLSQHDSNVTKDNIGYENGVLGGLVSTCNVLLERGDSVLLHSPTYIGFTRTLENNDYNIVLSPLIEENGQWVMDYEDMENKIVANNIKLAIICNPHNPSGRVWSKEELLKAMDIFEKHHVWVVSDEIWSDLILFGNTHTPTQSVNEYAKQHTVALYAPSKTFNLAGLVGAYHIIYNDELRAAVDKASSLSHYNSMNVLSMYALMGAYSSEGKEWLNELREVLAENCNYACNFINEQLPGVTVKKPQGTYMLFIDCKEYCLKHQITMDDLIHRGWKYGVYWQDGRPFHGPYNIRMNLALPLSRVEEAFTRLKNYVFTD